MIFGGRHARVDLSPWMNYNRELSRRLKATLPDVIRQEAGTILKSAMGKHKVAAPEQLRRAARLKVYSRADVADHEMLRGKDNLIWLRRRGAARFRMIGRWDGEYGGIGPNAGSPWHRVDADLWRHFWTTWRGLERTAKKAETEHLAARGLTRKSYTDLIRQIGAPEALRKVPRYVVNARPIGRRRDVSHSRESGRLSPRYVLTTSNGSGLAISTQGHRHMRWAMANRAAFFRRAIKQGFVDDARFLQRNFRWARVN